MPQCCAVPMCANRKGGHRFPTRDKHRLLQWLAAICRDNFTPNKNSVVCKSHFTSNDYVLPMESVLQNPRPVLKKTAVPSIFLWNDANSDKQSLINKRRRRCLGRNVKKLCIQENINKEKECDGTFLI